ncbi:recombinase RecA [Endozoicomonas sp. G2_2]|nr:recombinase RecA [Endozoicomonas sp. G2_2]
MTEDRSKALSAALKAIEKSYGTAAIYKMKDGPNVQVDRVSSGLIGLDRVIGGGLPRGRVLEVYGPESSGKTTIALSIVAAFQRVGGLAAFIDAEHALDPVWAETLGVDVDELHIAQPDTGEQALEIADMLVRSGGIDVVVVDSVAALTPKAEIEGDMGDSHVGLQARLMSQALRKLTGNIKRTGTLVIFINQIRMKIGVMFGSPETTTGGNALKFYASIRLDVRRAEQIKEGENVIGAVTRIKVAKNKVGRPFGKVELPLYFDCGLCPASDLINQALSAGVLEKNGSWYRFDGQQIAQGQAALRKRLLDNRDLYDAMRNRVLGKDNPSANDPAADMAGTDAGKEAVVSTQ